MIFWENQLRPLTSFILLYGVFGAAGIVSATNYQINFTVANGSPAPTSGAFDWNGSTFSNFIVIWDGFTFDMTSLANFPSHYGPPASCGSTATDFFNFMVTGQACTPEGGAGYHWGAQSLNYDTSFAIIDNTPTASAAIIANNDFGIIANFTNHDSRGDFTSSAVVTTPEPGTLSIALVGLLTLVAWKRASQIPSLLTRRYCEHF